MPAKLAIATPDAIEATALGGALRSRIDHENRLIVAPVSGRAIVLGAFQRAGSTIDLERAARAREAIGRRSTGGVAVRVREGQVFVSLALASASALGGVDDLGRALNRHVRPLLRALSTFGAQATYGGRDFVSIAGVPIAFVAVAHDTKSGALGLEAIVAVDAPFSLDAEDDLAHGAIAPRWLGKSPGSLSASLRRRIDLTAVVRAIASAYASQAGDDVTTFEAGAFVALDPRCEERPFDALVEEAMGLVGAAIDPDAIAIGGELMASADALAALGRALKALGDDPADDALGTTIDAALGPSSGALLFGVRSLASIAKVVRAAQKQGRAS